MKLIFHLFLFLFLLINLESIAQENQISNVIVIENGVKYYKHVIKKGEDLPSLCKLYKTTEQNIHKANNGFLPGIVPGQTIKIPAVYFPKAEGKIKVREHKTQKKQTLYAISKMYHTTVDEIVKYNPVLKNSTLKHGQILRIPDHGQEPVQQIFVSEDDQFIYYKTQKKGLSLYSIAQEHNVEFEKLHKANPHLGGKLKKGQQIKIPKKSEISQVVKEQIAEVEKEINENEKKTVTGDPLFFINPQHKLQRIDYDTNPITLNIVALLPLHLSENEKIGFHVSEKKDNKYYKLSRRVIEFYTGLLMAVDTLKLSGIKINLQIYDTKADTTVVKEIFGSGKMENTHLIIGPLYPRPFQMAEKYAKIDKINIVSPFYYANNIEHSGALDQNPYYFQVEPTVMTRIKAFAENISKSRNGKIFILNNIKTKDEDEYTTAEKKELKLISMYKEQLFDSFSKYNILGSIDYKEISYKESKVKGVKKLLFDSLENVIIVPSNDKKFVINLIPQLNILSKKYNITLYGAPEWEQYNNLELEHLHNLKLHTCTSTFLDYDDQEVIEFIQKYRDTFSTEPSQLTFKSYDILIYFVNIMREYGTDIQPFISSPQSTLKRGLSSIFDFKRVSDFGGLENNKLFVIKYNMDFSVSRER